MSTAVRPATKRNSFGRGARQGWVGIDVGTTSLKVAQVEGTGLSRRLVAGQLLPIEESTSNQTDEESELVNPESWPFSRIERYRSKAAIGSLPRNCIEFRTLQMPPATDAELRQLISQELAETVTEEVVFDFWVGELNESAKRKQTTEVSVSCVAARVASSFGKELQQAGLSCRVIDTAPFAFARAVDLMKGSQREESTLALDLGETASSITWIINGKPAAYREMRSSGIQQITQSLTSGLKLSVADCRLLLQRPGLQSHLQIKETSELRRAIRELTGPPVKRIIGELKKTIRFSSMLQKHPIQEIVLFGGGAGISGMDQLISDSLEIPTSTWSMPHDDHLLVPIHLLGLAAGLSARGMQ